MVFQKLTEEQRKHGVVYTPQPIAEFMWRSVSRVLRQEFDKSLDSAGVKILEPFCGDGAILRALCTSGIMSRDALQEKIRQDCLGLEIDPQAAKAAKASIAEVAGLDASEVTVESGDTFLRPPASGYEVIVTNPPYAVRNKSVYPELDGALKAAFGGKKAEGHWRDSCIRALYWCTARLERGCVCFLTNASLLNGLSNTSVRSYLAQHFSSIYILDCLGNHRTAGAENRRQGGNIFGAQVRVGTAIVLLVKNGRRAQGVYVGALPAHTTTRQKLEFIGETQCLQDIPATQVHRPEGGLWCAIPAEYETFVSMDKIFTRRRSGVRPTPEAQRLSTSAMADSVPIVRMPFESWWYRPRAGEHPTTEGVFLAINCRDTRAALCAFVARDSAVHASASGDATYVWQGPLDPFGVGADNTMAYVLAVLHHRTYVTRYSMVAPYLGVRIPALVAKRVFVEHGRRLMAIYLGKDTEGPVPENSAWEYQNAGRSLLKRITLLRGMRGEKADLTYAQQQTAKLVRVTHEISALPFLQCGTCTDRAAA